MARSPARTLAAGHALVGRSYARSSQDVAASSAALGSADVAVSDELVPVSKELASEELFAGSASVFADSAETFADVEEVLDSIEEVITGSEEVFADSVKQVAASVEMVPDSVEPPCPRCSTFHAGGVFGEECYQAHREARRCARCGLLHEDYDMIAKWLDYLDKFDCEIYIPDVSKLQMDGNTIILPEHVINKLDKIRDAKKLELAKLKQDANKEQ